MAGLACLVLCGAASAAGTQVEVSRVVLQFQETGWQDRPVEVKALQVDSGVYGEIARAGRVIYLPGAGNGPLRAAMLASATGGRGNVRMPSQCEPIQDAYVNDLTGGRKFAPECVTVFGPLPTAEVVAKYFPSLKATLDAEKQTLAPASWLVRTLSANENGSVVYLDLFVDADALDLPDAKSQATPPPHIPSAVAAWADALGLGVRNSLSSMSGRLPVPALHFKDAAAR